MALWCHLPQQVWLYHIGSHRLCLSSFFSMLLCIWQGAMMFKKVTTPNTFIQPCACTVWLWPATISILSRMTEKECIGSSCHLCQYHTPHVFIWLFHWLVYICWNCHVPLLPEQPLMVHIFAFRPGSAHIWKYKEFSIHTYVWMSTQIFIKI